MLVDQTALRIVVGGRRRGPRQTLSSSWLPHKEYLTPDTAGRCELIVRQCWVVPLAILLLLLAMRKFVRTRLKLPRHAHHPSLGMQTMIDANARGI